MSIVIDETKTFTIKLEVVEKPPEEEKPPEKKPFPWETVAVAGGILATVTGIILATKK